MNIKKRLIFSFYKKKNSYLASRVTLPCQAGEVFSTTPVTNAIYELLRAQERLKVYLVHNVTMNAARNVKYAG